MFAYGMPPLRPCMINMVHGDNVWSHGHRDVNKLPVPPGREVPWCLWRQTALWVANFTGASRVRLICETQFILSEYLLASDMLDAGEPGVYEEPK